MGEAAKASALSTALVHIDEAANRPQLQQAA